VSPLRYPGAKRRLSAYIAETLRLNGVRPRLFVEPFAGGASVSLELLQRDLVDEVALGERDPLVADFWRVLFREPEWLIDQIEKIDVSVETWRDFKYGVHNSERERALACLYLNRTSFSGILNRRAGPIGGQKQKSEYSIGCRFSPRMLARRIRQAAALAGRVRFVHRGRWEGAISRAKRSGLPGDSLFFYLDPPFYEKADRLYSFCFEEKDHVRLRDFLLKLRSRWFLSYDPAREIVALYGKRGFQKPRQFRQVDLLYSVAAGSDLLRSRELIVTNLDRLPRRTRLWRSVSEWRE
jgi:DNA adenine methylase